MQEASKEEKHDCLFSLVIPEKIYPRCRKQARRKSMIACLLLVSLKRYNIYDAGSKQGGTA
jgi:hypothetical protein